MYGKYIFTCCVYSTTATSNFPLDYNTRESPPAHPFLAGASGPPPALPVLIDSPIRNEQQQPGTLGNCQICHPHAPASGFCHLIGQSYQTLSSGGGAAVIHILLCSENEESLRARQRDIKSITHTHTHINSLTSS